ncbi:hypothetical protein, partial [Mesorhizobium sp. M8A.F.Ca.ET.218.01.1.1]|uniref:hypothetical protein n=1 Tax=Mesorhizobium sp. M8A.F.Ca.ET.218.01.1.1 TaxID=2563971 RepID=UPI001AEE337B
PELTNGVEEADNTRLDGVDLEEMAGPFRFAALGQAYGVALADKAEAAAAKLRRKDGYKCRPL